MIDNNLCPHDRFFRKLMSNTNIARDFFRHILPPDIQAMINFDNMQLMHDSFIDDKLRQQTSDLLYSIAFNDNQPGYIYILAEHQSVPTAMMPFRILKYMTAIMDQHLDQTDDKVLPVVYPLIFYSGAKSYNYSTDLFELFGKYNDFARKLWSHPYQLINLPETSDADFEKFKLSCGMVKLMKYIHQHKDDIVALLEKVAPNLRETMHICGMDYIYIALTYLLECGNIYDADDFKNTVKREFSEIDEDGFMTLMNPWCNEALQKGLTEGRREGRLQGKIEVASGMLAHGIPVETVAATTGLPLSKIMELQKQ